MPEFSQAEMRNTEAACYALCVDYAEIVDSRAWERLVEIFAEDATFTKPVPAQEVIHGAEKIVAWFQSFPKNRLTNHLISNFRVRMETNDTAVGSCRVLLYTSDVSEPETPEGRQAAPMQMMGIYYDRYVRTQHGWRFAERVASVTFHT